MKVLLLDRDLDVLLILVTAPYWR